MSIGLPWVLLPGETEMSRLFTCGKAFGVLVRETLLCQIEFAEGVKEGLGEDIDALMARLSSLIIAAPPAEKTEPTEDELS
jgi:hypothetical protein